ncbi:UbiD family decarboxylase [Paraliomyxa miuraensis]|uniref:UbiD family decarboxylase n=1 Tax=Paraliomyxa miuraensis TaxID=376150 RepID=UPI002259B4CD|nr:UbiD family decarboxylase [Paraliomyxa miuraensis]MCX4244722.1 UbiD family decarboxylase [Paraliomyxa miuraensis]
MAYRSLRQCIDDLERHRHLVRVAQPVDPHLELAAIQRRLYAAGGPAVLFERVHGSPFPAVSNLYGTMERGRFIFRDTLARVRQAIELRADPVAALRRPWRYLSAPLTGLRSLPMRVSGGPVLAHRTTVSQLPGIVSWPRDGGPFITLPQVLTRRPGGRGIMDSNLGMYRVQLAGNDYERDVEVGLHYQIHRGIGVHHAAARDRSEPLRVSVFVGGPPAHAFAAVMPMPEGMSELVMAGMLAGRRFRWAEVDGHVVSTDADFCLVGRIDPTRTKPEGPFGDHLGYYSLVHDFPVMEVEAVYHREGAIWPFTVVGRPPQEDTTFGALIHELTAPMVPVEIPGLVAMHAVDAAGVHPLMLALGSERYVPYRPRQPQELLTLANAILGFNQASLAKYLVIAAHEDEPALALHDEAAFLRHVLRRFDPRRDLHFHTRTTIDTLDYSGTGLNAGSKLVIAAAGEIVRELGTETPADLPLPEGFGPVRLVMPGVLAVQGPEWDGSGEAVAAGLGAALEGSALHGLDTRWPLVVLCDDADMVARSLANFLWVTFTRSNPAHDVHGVGAFVEHKHWGCHGAVIVDARSKAHHAPALEEDPEVTRRVEALAGPGGPLHGLF